MDNLFDQHTALGFLRAEHSRLAEFLATCEFIDQPDFIAQTLTPMSQEFKAHSALEHDCFYPFIMQFLECDDAHAVQAQRSVYFGDQADVLGQQMAQVDPASAAYFPKLEELEEAFQRHCYYEEMFMFPLLEMSSPQVTNKMVELVNDMIAKRGALLNYPERRINAEAARQARLGTRDAMLESPPAEAEGDEIPPEAPPQKC